MSYEIDREDVLLLLLDANRRLSGATSLKGITRLEKLVFLLGHEKGLGAVTEHFDFSAYKFGPFSKDVYEGAEFLRGLDFVEITERPLVSHFATTEEELLTDETADSNDDDAAVASQEKVFVLTESGNKVAAALRDIWRRERPDDLAKIEDVIRRFGTMPLTQLIRYVYRRFPDMAAKSIHPEADKLGTRRS